MLKYTYLYILYSLYKLYESGYIIIYFWSKKFKQKIQFRFHNLSLFARVFNIMLIEFEEFQAQFFPLSDPVPNKNIFISSQDQIVKFNEYDQEYWRKWKNFIQDEIDLQSKMNCIAPNSFLKIINWTSKLKNDKYVVYIVYESTKFSQNLEEYVKTNDDMVIMNVVRQILQIGCELEKCEVFHMNIKPNNFIVVDREVKLTDFGSARVLNDYFFEKDQKAYHYYQCEQLLNIKQIPNKSEQITKLNEINNDKSKRNTIYRQNDDWGLGIILSQVLLKNFDLKIQKLENYLALNDFRIEEIIKEIQKKQSNYLSLLKNLMQNKIGTKQALSKLSNSIKQKNTGVKTPLIWQVDPPESSHNSERRIESLISDNFYFIPQSGENQNLCSKSEEPLHTEKEEKQIISMSSNSSDRLFFDDMQRSQLIKTVQNSQSNCQVLTLETIKNENIPSKTERHQQSFASSYFGVNNQEVKLNQDNQVNISFQPQKLPQSDLLVNKKQKIFDQFQAIIKDLKSKMIVQFYTQIIENNINMNPQKHSELYNYESEELLFYQNSICEYTGFQQSSKPHGFGIQFRKKEKCKLILGLFNQGNILWGYQIEEVNNNTIQHYIGDFDEKEVKNGSCQIDWYTYDQLKGFTKVQSHVGQIQNGAINGDGERTYYYTDKTDYKFNLLYKGAFMNFQRHGKGQLYKITDNKMQKIYDGEFKFDKYSGSGKAVLDKDLIVEGTFEKGKTQEIKNIIYKSQMMEERKLQMFQ